MTSEVNNHHSDCISYSIRRDQKGDLFAVERAAGRPSLAWKWSIIIRSFVRLLMSERTRARARVTFKKRKKVVGFRLNARVIFGHGIALWLWIGKRLKHRFRIASRRLLLGVLGYFVATYHLLCLYSDGPRSEGCTPNSTSGR